MCSFEMLLDDFHILYTLCSSAPLSAVCPASPVLKEAVGTCLFITALRVISRWSQGQDSCDLKETLILIPLSDLLNFRIMALSFMCIYKAMCSPIFKVLSRQLCSQTQASGSLWVEVKKYISCRHPTLEI